MNARYYEPESGRFLTPDTYTGNPYNPNTQNVYSYTGNNPVNYVDPTGHVALAAGAEAAGLGALGVVSSVVITVVFVASIIATVYLVKEAVESISYALATPDTPDSTDQTDTGEEKPSVEYPNDPTKPPGEGWEWRGKGYPESGEGNWYNPQTGESLHPDLDHPDPIGPHWDYKPYRNGPEYRWSPDGTLSPK